MFRDNVTRFPMLILPVLLITGCGPSSESPQDNTGPLSMIVDSGADYYAVDPETMLHGICWNRGDGEIQAVYRDGSGGISQWRESGEAASDEQGLQQAGALLARMRLHRATALFTRDAVIHGGYRLNSIFNINGLPYAVNLTMSIPSSSDWDAGNGKEVELHAHAELPDALAVDRVENDRAGRYEICMQMVAYRVPEPDNLTASR